MLNMRYDVELNNKDLIFKLDEKEIILKPNYTKTNDFLRALKSLTSLEYVKSNGNPMTFSDYVSDKKLRSDLEKIVLSFLGIDKESDEYLKMFKKLSMSLGNDLDYTADLPTEIRRFTFGDNNHATWIDIFSAINNMMHCFNINGTKFSEFKDRYFNFVSIFDYEKPIVFYPRSIYEIVEAICIYLCRNTIDYEKTINRIIVNKDKITSCNDDILYYSNDFILNEINNTVEAILLLQKSDEFVTNIISDELLDKFINIYIFKLDIDSDLKNKLKGIDPLEIVVDLFTVFFKYEKEKELKNTFFIGKYDEFYFSVISKLTKDIFDYDLYKNDEIYKEYTDIKDKVDYELLSRDKSKLFSKAINLLDRREKIFYKLIIEYVDYQNNYNREINNTFDYYIDGIYSYIIKDSDDFKIDKKFFSDHYKIKKHQIYGLIKTLRHIYILKNLDKNNLDTKYINKKLTEYNLAPVKVFGFGDKGEVIKGLEYDYIIYNYIYEKTLSRENEEGELGFGE